MKFNKYLKNLKKAIVESQLMNYNQYLNTFLDLLFKIRVHKIQRNQKNYINICNYMTDKNAKQS